MALGMSTKNTICGNNITDVIKDNEPFAKIRLFIYNNGNESLKNMVKKYVLKEYYKK